MAYFLSLFLILFIYMSFWFLISVIKKRNDVADVAWGLGFVLLSWASILVLGNLEFKNILVGILITIWGTRLAWHIYQRHRNQAEDYRYLQWRKEWGKFFFLRSYLQVFLLQGFFLYLVSLPVLFINFNKSIFSVIDALGVLIWIIGFTFESVGDYQLKKFKENPQNKGKLITTGLWKYSRHPNYFGEVTQWWGIWVMSLFSPYWYLSIIGPITITFLITKVSGIPMLEKKMAENPDFLEYKRKTSVFIPLPPKK